MEALQYPKKKKELSVWAFSCLIRDLEDKVQISLILQFEN